jgi:hypothetical protein
MRDASSGSRRDHQFQKRQIGSLTSGLLRNLMLMTTGGTVLIALVLGFGILRSGTRFFEGLNAIFNAPSLNLK